MVSSKTSAVSRQSSEVPQPEHEKEAALSCTSSSTASDDTTDITLVFPAEISYRLDTEGPGARILSKADPIKSGYHDWYIRNLSIQAGTIGDCDGIVSAINTQDQPIDFPTPLGDIRAGRFSGSWVTQAQEGTKATDATFFHSAERKYFEGVQEETGNEYELLSVEVGDYVNGDEGELVNYSTFRDAVQSDTKKNGNLSKWYDNARWTFRAQ
ncbi:hypothetical protein I350_07991 [Cryptococcus amylolentus CBS 6273]|uniref:Uncharacterized protein n=1 Tax=Cryptococcus amylolentus CBS 6273 TaxID=1296118 RepID=A0A1E3J815_9TREE|nr:hypothetical protein I350_07991 [Cryptococcus amylolentus CBS 6273]